MHNIHNYERTKQPRLAVTICKVQSSAHALLLSYDETHKQAQTDPLHDEGQAPDLQ